MQRRVPNYLQLRLSPLLPILVSRPYFLKSICAVTEFKLQFTNTIEVPISFAVFGEETRILTDSKATVSFRGQGQLAVVVVIATAIAFAATATTATVMAMFMQAAGFMAAAIGSIRVGSTKVG